MKQKHLNQGVIITIFCTIFLSTTTFGQNGITGTYGGLHLHDPSLIRVGNSTYAFSTGWGTTAKIVKTTDESMTTGWDILSYAPSNSMPSWIAPYFTSRGLNTPDNIWAPDINYWNGKYYLYYSSSVWNTDYAVCGLATATNIEGPWTDQGIITDVNYPIDPHVIWDGSTPYLVWGSFTGPGIYIHEIDSSTGKLSTTNTTMTRIATGIEGVSIVSHGGYFYLFGSKGTCCVGANSTYYTVVGRSTSLTGPYYDRNGVSMTNGGGTTILSTNGDEIGPGGGDYFMVGSDYYFGYHFYDGTNNGDAKLNIRKIDFVGLEGQNGWPTFGAPLGSTYYRLQNSATQLYVDGMGRTVNGNACGQWSDSGSYNQEWSKENVGSYVKFRNRATGLYLDGSGRSTNGSACAQYCSGSSYNQQWIQENYSNYTKFKNRATGLYLDGMGRTSNGSDLGQWNNSTSSNQRFWLQSQNTLKNTSQNKLDISLNEDSSLSEPDEKSAVKVFPNPTSGEFDIYLPTSDEVVTIGIYSADAKLISKRNYQIQNGKVHLNIEKELTGIYLVKIQSNPEEIVKIIKK